MAPRLYCERGSPCLAASVYSRAASARLRSMPRPSSYMTPRLHCALRSPCLAPSVKNRTASVTLPRSNAIMPRQKCARPELGLSSAASLNSRSASTNSRSTTPCPWDWSLPRRKWLMPRPINLLKFAAAFRLASSASLAALAFFFSASLAAFAFFRMYRLLWLNPPWLDTLPPFPRLLFPIARISDSTGPPLAYVLRVAVSCFTPSACTSPASTDRADLALRSRALRLRLALRRCRCPPLRLLAIAGFELKMRPPRRDQMTRLARR